MKKLLLALTLIMSANVFNGMHRTPKVPAPVSTDPVDTELAGILAKLDVGKSTTTVELEQIQAHIEKYRAFVAYKDNNPGMLDASTIANINAKIDADIKKVKMHIDQYDAFWSIPKVTKQYKSAYAKLADAKTRLNGWSTDFDTWLDAKKTNWWRFGSTVATALGVAATFWIASMFKANPTQSTIASAQRK